MYFDLLNTTCTIYRLQGFTDYDFSVSDEGEVNEAWGIAAENVVCRVDRAYSPSRRRGDGVVETGQKLLFVNSDVDIRDADRITVDNIYYVVEDSSIINGMRDAHHIECRINLIDWNPPEDETEWIPPDSGDTAYIDAGRGIDLSSGAEDHTVVNSEFDIKEYDFTFETVSPITLAVVVDKERIKRVVMKIDTAFDDAATTLSVGHTGNVNGVMASTSNIPTFAGEYEVTPNIKYGGTDTIKFYINAGTSTQGAGTVFLETERND